MSTQEYNRQQIVTFYNQSTSPSDDSAEGFGSDGVTNTGESFHFIDESDMPGIPISSLPASITSTLTVSTTSGSTESVSSQQSFNQKKITLLHLSPENQVKVEDLLDELASKFDISNDQLFDNWDAFKQEIKNLDFTTSPLRRNLDELVTTLAPKLNHSDQLEASNLTKLIKKVKSLNLTLSEFVVEKDTLLLQATSVLIGQILSISKTFSDMEISINKELGTLANTQAAFTAYETIINRNRKDYQAQGELIKKASLAKDKLITDLQTRILSDPMTEICQRCALLTSKCHDVALTTLKSNIEEFRTRTYSFKEGIANLNSIFEELNAKICEFKKWYNFLYYLCLIKRRNTWKRRTYFLTCYAAGYYKCIDMSTEELKNLSSQKITLIKDSVTPTEPILILKDSGQHADSHSESMPRNQKKPRKNFVVTKPLTSSQVGRVTSQPLNFDDQHDTSAAPEKQLESKKDSESSGHEDSSDS